MSQSTDCCCTFKGDETGTIKNAVPGSLASPCSQVLRPLDTEELRKAVQPAPSKEFVFSKPPLIWLAMQTHSLARIADSTVWLTLQTQQSDSKCRLNINRLTHDADSTVWLPSIFKNATQQGEWSLAQTWRTPLLLFFENANSLAWEADPPVWLALQTQLSDSPSRLSSLTRDADSQSGTRCTIFLKMHLAGRNLAQNGGLPCC